MIASGATETGYPECQGVCKCPHRTNGDSYLHSRCTRSNDKRVHAPACIAHVRLSVHTHSHSLLLLCGILPGLQHACRCLRSSVFTNSTRDTGSCKLCASAVTCVFCMCTRKFVTNCRSNLTRVGRADWVCTCAHCVQC